MSHRDLQEDIGLELPFAGNMIAELLERTDGSIARGACLFCGLRKACREVTSAQSVLSSLRSASISKGLRRLKAM
jgi:hypothetical protein